MKSMGVRPGVSDYHLPVPRRGYNGLWLELKATPPNNAPVASTQREWLEEMSLNGYAAFICKGWEAAKEVFSWYLARQALHNESVLDHWIRCKRVIRIELAEARI